MKSTEAIKLNETTSLCSLCKEGIGAEIWEEEGKIFLEKNCPDHGKSRILLSSDAVWYHEVMKYPATLSAPPLIKKEIQYGCPYDCGACGSHQQKTYLPVVPITSACNLNCPICYTINKNDGAYHMSLEEFKETLNVISQNDPELKIINFTGGEPTMHPDLPGIIGLCHDAGIHRVTISTHGLTFLKKESLLKELAGLQARIVLSFNSFEDAINSQMTGAKLTSSKLKVLDLLEKYQVDTTIIPVLALGVNDGEIGKILNLLFERESLRSIEIHTITLTGQGGSQFGDQARITVPDVLRRIEEATDGKVTMADFLPSPCAHPLCYQTCYLLQMEGGDFLPFNRFMEKDQIRYLLTDNLYMEPGERMENTLQDVMMELWAREIPEETGEKVLKTIKNMIQRLFPSEPNSYANQQIIAERAAKTIYIHSHMDEDNFDTDRIAQCCVGVPSPDGTTIPTCAYNVLYRERDERFSKGSPKPFSDFGGGRKEWG